MKRLLLAMLLCLGCRAQDFRIYAIDVEGGKSTLYVSPSGESMLVDTGYGGFNSRDARRIVAAARAAGVKQIDYLVITHYHTDHAGGVPQLAAMMPIRRFLDHGRTFEANGSPVYDAYLAVREKGPHTELHAGDRVPVKGIGVEVVTSSGIAIKQPLAGAGQPNPLCASFQALPLDKGENAHSLGMVITYGKFRMVDLGDLHWNQEYDLACPNNLLGTVDVFMTTHHAKKTSIAPQIVHALGFKAAIMNNGPTLGADPAPWQTIHDAPGSPDIWQLHTALNNDAAHNAPEKFTANLAENCKADWILLTAHADGTFAIRNGRNGWEKVYR